MRILIQPPRPTAEVHLVIDQVRRALDVLDAASIKTEGGGTIESDGIVTGVIVVKLDEDVAKAIAVLAQAGITASIG
jgi:hypothetical protein